MPARSSRSTRTAKRRSSRSPTSVWSATCSRSCRSWRRRWPDVVPAQAGTQVGEWIPACAGMTPEVRLRRTSDLCQRMLSAGHVELALRFDVDVLDDAVVDDQREALATRTHAKAGGIQLQTERLGVVAIAVGQHVDLAVGVLGLA